MIGFCFMRINLIFIELEGRSGLRHQNLTLEIFKLITSLSADFLTQPDNITY
jgi:hypothetical protein